MATIKRFEDIIALQAARELSKQIYTITKNQYFSSDFSLKTQMLKYIDETLHSRLNAMSTDISKMISGLIKYLNQTEIKGEKYKNRVSEDIVNYITLPSKFINPNTTSNKKL